MKTSIWTHLPNEKWKIVLKVRGTRAISKLPWCMQQPDSRFFSSGENISRIFFFFQMSLGWGNRIKRSLYTVVVFSVNTDLFIHSCLVLSYRPIYLMTRAKPQRRTHKIIILCRWNSLTDTNSSRLKCSSMTIVSDRTPLISPHGSFSICLRRSGGPDKHMQSVTAHNW